MYVVQDAVREPLYVITTLSNPQRSKTRLKLLQRFVKQMVDAGAVLYLVEAAFGEREYASDHYAPHKQAATAPALGQELIANCIHDDPRRGQHKYIQVRTSCEVWLKECLTNVGLRRLPSDAKYVAWIDCDFAFARTNWVGECVQLLQHYDFLQMFTHYFDLGPNSEAISGAKMGFVKCWLDGLSPPPNPTYYYQPRGKGIAAWSPGGAWAARVETLQQLGGLMDFNIVGGGDNHTAFALIGQIDRFFFSGMSDGYKRRLLAWQALALKYVRRNIGVMEGAAWHYWHGRKSQRGYADRWRILADTGFDPDKHLRYDLQGVLQLVDWGDDAFLHQRDGLRNYFRSRNEDSIDVE